MTDLMDLFKLSTTTNGAAGNPFAAPFDLSPEQSALVAETMLPMIAQVLQRQLSDPRTAAKWVQFLASMPVARIEPSDAAVKAAAKLFGSQEIADALAKQVSAASGVTQAVTKAMVPWVAAMMVGGLAAAGAKPGAEVEDMTEAMQPVLATIPNPMGPKSIADETIGEFVRGYNRGRPEVPPEPDLTEAERLLAQMVEAGRKAQAAQTEAFDAMLDTWFGRKS